MEPRCEAILDDVNDDMMMAKILSMIIMRMSITMMIMTTIMMMLTNRTTYLA